MAVVFDAKVTSTTDTGAVLTVSNTTLTVGSGANRALVAALGFVSSTTPTALSVHWDPGGANQALTQITGAIINTAFTETLILFALLNPVSGNKTLTATWTTTSVESHLAAASFTGVDQTSVAVAFPHGTSKSALAQTSGTLPITSVIGNMIVAAYCQSAALFSAVSGNTLSLDGTATGTIAMASLYDAGATTVNTTAAWGGTSTDYATVGTDILAAAGGPVGTFMVFAGQRITVNVSETISVSFPGH